MSFGIEKPGTLRKRGMRGDLAQGIKWVLSDRSRWIALSRRCRELAEGEYALDLQVCPAMSVCIVNCSP